MADLSTGRGSGGWRENLHAVTSAVLLVASVVLIWIHVQRPTPPAAARPEIAVPADPLSIAGAASRGSPTAAAIVMMFSDFRCQYCRRFALDIWPSLEREHVAIDSVQFIFRHLPLSLREAAVGARCAHEQDQFWPMHDELFREAAGLDAMAVRGIAERLNLDMTRFDLCLGGKGAERVTADVDEAARLGIRGTPTFVFGHRLANGQMRATKVIQGMLPVESFREELNASAASAQYDDVKRSRNRPRVIIGTAVPLLLGAALWIRRRRRAPIGNAESQLH